MCYNGVKLAPCFTFLIALYQEKLGGGYGAAASGAARGRRNSANMECECVRSGGDDSGSFLERKVHVKSGRM